MARYYQKINELGEVEKVVVAESKQWLIDNLGGNWEAITKTEIDKNDIIYYSAFMEKIYSEDNTEKK